MKKNLLILDETWMDLHDLVIYGFGKIAQGMIDLFIDMFQVEYIIDNSKEDKEYRNIPIISFETYNNLNIRRKIIILTGKKAYYSIKKDLEKRNNVEYMDFCDINTFYEDWFGNYKDEICIGRTILSVSTRCTLNCKKCNMLTPYFKEKKDFDIKMLEKDADMLFGILDYVSNLVIVGGEAFLYPQLDEFVRYIGEKYRLRIGNLQIITNGMIIPNEATLKVFKENNVEIRISDYTQEVNYKDQLEKLREILKKNDIHYITFEQNEWLDFGFPEEKLSIGRNKDEIRQHMMECQPMCPLVHDGKMFFCTSSWAAHESGLYELEQGDWIDLYEKDKFTRENLLNFYLGKTEKGYISFCQRCRGFAGNDHLIRAGEQFDRKRV